MRVSIGNREVWETQLMQKKKHTKISERYNTGIELKVFWGAESKYHIQF